MLLGPKDSCASCLMISPRHSRSLVPEDQVASSVLVPSYLVTFCDEKFLFYLVLDTVSALCHVRISVFCVLSANRILCLLRILVLSVPSYLRTSCTFVPSYFPYLRTSRIFVPSYVVYNA